MLFLHTNTHTHTEKHTEKHWLRGSCGWASARASIAYPSDTIKKHSKKTQSTKQQPFAGAHVARIKNGQSEKPNKPKFKIQKINRSAAKKTHTQENTYTNTERGQSGQHLTANLSSDFAKTAKQISSVKRLKLLCLLRLLWILWIDFALCFHLHMFPLLLFVTFACTC